MYLFAIQHQQNDEAADHESAPRREHNRRRLIDRCFHLGENLTLLQRDNSAVHRHGSRAMREARRGRVRGRAQHGKLLDPREFLQMERHVHLVCADDLEAQDRRVLIDFHPHVFLQPRSEFLQKVLGFLHESRFISSEKSTGETQCHLYRFDRRWY